MNPKVKKTGLYFIKLLVASGVLYFVYTKIDFQVLQNEVSKITWISVSLGILMFTISKVLASIRLTYFIRVSGYEISQIENFKLYLLGMFYNLFLPGGIGGDAYKIYYLNKTGNTKTKDAVWPFLLDRASGMFSLAVLTIILGLFIKQSFIPYQSILLITLLILGSISSFCFVWFSKRIYITTFTKTLIWSFLSQLSQVSCIYFYINDLDNISSKLEYYLLFLISSLVSIVPISPGGLGLREITYQQGAKYFNTLETVGVMLGSLFFATSVLVSAFGIYFHFFGLNKKSNI